MGERVQSIRMDWEDSVSCKRRLREHVRTTVLNDYVGVSLPHIIERPLQKRSYTKRR